MRKFALLLFFLLTASLFALDLSFQSGKKKNTAYALLYISDKTPFLCKANRDNFNEIKEVVCSFEKNSATTLPPVANNFFHVKFIQTRGELSMHVTCNHYLGFRPLYFNLTQERELVYAEGFASNRYVLYGYEKKPFVLGAPVEPNENSIHFPILFKSEKLPAVGSLDLKGNPVELSKIKDVNDYLQIKKEYENQKYNEVLKSINSLLESYPNTIFKAEMMLYQIRCYQRLLESENVIEIGKKFLRYYSFDENTPEVLAVLGQAYGIIGMNADADYFFDRLFSDYPKSRFVAEAYIYKAEQLETNGQAKKAISYYEKAMYEAKDKDVASLAALRVSEYFINLAKKQKAKKYLHKVLSSNPSYFKKNYTLSMKLARSFAERHEYKEAANIAEALLTFMNTADDEYENIMRQVALWQYETEDANATGLAVERYLKTYKYGEYREELQALKEQLFFDVDETNVTKALNYYDDLIERYAQSDTEKKAYFKKANLLLNAKRYKQLLDLNSTLMALDEEQAKPIIVQGATRAMVDALQKPSCDEALYYLKNYPVIREGHVKALFSCALKRLDVTTAQQLYDVYHSTDVKALPYWLDAAFSLAVAKRDYNDQLRLTYDIAALQGENYHNMLRKRFDAAQALRKSAVMIATIKRIEKTYGLKAEDLERYMQMVLLGKKNADKTLIGTYAPKVIAIKKRTQSELFSPEIEFIYAKYFIDKKDENSAIDTLKRLYKISMEPNDEARFYYSIGALYESKGSRKAAKQEYERAISADANSSWATLSRDALKLLR